VIKAETWRVLRRSGEPAGPAPAPAAAAAPAPASATTWHSNDSTPIEDDVPF